MVAAKDDPMTCLVTRGGREGGVCGLAEGTSKVDIVTLAEAKQTKAFQRS